MQADNFIRPQAQFDSFDPIGAFIRSSFNQHRQIAGVSWEVLHLSSRRPVAGGTKIMTGRHRSNRHRASLTGIVEAIEALAPASTVIIFSEIELLADVMAASGPPEWLRNRETTEHDNWDRIVHVLTERSITAEAVTWPLEGRDHHQVSGYLQVRTAQAIARDIRARSL